MSNLADIQESLQTALAESAAAQAELDRAMTALQPLQQAAMEKRQAVSNLIAKYQTLNSEAGGTKQKRPRKAYNITPESKLASMYKRTLTRLVNKGVDEKTAKKQAKEASESLRAKLGI